MSRAPVRRISFACEGYEPLAATQLPARDCPRPGALRSQVARRGRNRHPPNYPIQATYDLCHGLPRWWQYPSGAAERRSVLVSESTPRRSSRRRVRVSPGLQAFRGPGGTGHDIQTLCARIMLSLGALLLTGGTKGKRVALPKRDDPDPPGIRQLRRTSNRHRDSGKRGDQRQAAPRRDHRRAHRSATRACLERHATRLHDAASTGTVYEAHRPEERGALRLTHRLPVS